MLNFLHNIYNLKKRFPSNHNNWTTVPPRLRLLGKSIQCQAVLKGIRLIFIIMLGSIQYRGSWFSYVTTRSLILNPVTTCSLQIALPMLTIKKRIVQIWVEPTSTRQGIVMGNYFRKNTMLDGAKYLRGINRGYQGGIASIAGTGCIHEAKFKSGFFSTGPRRFRECVHLKPVLLEQSPFQVGCKQTCGLCRKPCVVVRISAKSSYSLPNFFMPDKFHFLFAQK